MIGVLAVVGLVVVVIVASVRIARWASSSEVQHAVCASCGGTLDRRTLACRGCGADVRHVGLVPPDAGAAPQWLISCFVWTAAAPVLLVVLAILFGALFASGTSARPLVFDPQSARAEGPASGAYGAMVVSWQTQAAGDQLFAVFDLEDADGRDLGSLMALRGEHEAIVRIESTTGPELTAQSLGAWMAARRPDADPAQLELEAAEIISLCAPIRPTDPSPDDAAGLLALEDTGEITERQLDMALQSGVLLDHFASWDAAQGQSGSGGGMAGLGFLRAPLWITIVVWLIGVGLIARSRTWRARRGDTPAPATGASSAARAG